MDRFSFLNAAHTAFFADLYDQYLQNPDSVEPSWRSIFILPNQLRRIMRLLAQKVVKE
jgi:2-oxoglutarate dehydrogenase complex dehydrogenase (E1) component-like enzyme